MPIHTQISSSPKKPFLKLSQLSGAIVSSLLVLSGCSNVFIDSSSSSRQGTSVKELPNGYVFTASNGNRLRLTGYGDSIVRVQHAMKGETFFADDHYEMVVSHDWPNQLSMQNSDAQYVISTPELVVHVDKQSLALDYYLPNQPQAVLEESKPIDWTETGIEVSFEHDPNENFTGLGHGYYARANSLNLKGQRISRTYGSKPIEQAPLIVPFYMSNKGYGVFLNSMFENEFSFGAEGEYSVAIKDGGFDSRMDYFFIAGPKLTEVIDNYTELTGRPRLPQKSVFGLQLSDKGHDHNSDTPSDVNWWKQKIGEHRAQQLPLDHVVNDNRWRAAGGKRCESKIAWDSERYPDPAAYAQWLEENGLTVTLDFNRCIGQYSEGWHASFNLPETGEIEFPDSAPDLTNVEFRDWFWQVFETQALKPKLNFPGDALWIDEFDEQGHAPKEMILSNGRSSGEMRNYWFFLIAKALVEQGWDKSPIDKRPFVWVRGMTAGAQRYATLWSGDIYPNYKDMEGQIRGMQLAGLSGFPFWGHDAGGFFDWNAGLGPDEEMYQRWAMAFGSFAPIWKPHGMGQSRWPLDRSESSLQTARKFSQIRYQLIPYLYSVAHHASQTGTPIARPMLLDYQNEPLAWQYDLQYMWGPSLLVAPLTKDEGTKQVWLPKGKWYGVPSGQQFDGNRVIEVAPELSELPKFAKAGSIIPKREYALSTRFIDKSTLDLDVYVGADGNFVLYEDDDITERFNTHQELRTTEVSYSESTQSLTLNAAKGTFVGANVSRNLTVRFYGLENAGKKRIFVNGKELDSYVHNGVLEVQLSKAPVTNVHVFEIKNA